MDRIFVATVLVFTGIVVACADGGGTDAGSSGIDPKLSVLKEEIFSPNCSSASCHGGSNPANGLDLDSDGVFGRLVDVDGSIVGQKLVVPGDPDASLLYLAVLNGFESGGIRQMPPGSELAAEKLEAIRAWIEDGAADN